MFLYRVKIEQLDASRVVSLKANLARGEEGLRARCPIREMSVVSEGADRRELDIYVALDDVIDKDQLRCLVGELQAMIDLDPKPGLAPAPRVSSELIHI
jgi:hypothetical protein